MPVTQPVTAGHTCDTKLCPVCGCEFSRRRDTTAARWAVQRCCGTDCGRRLAGTISTIWSDDELERAGSLRDRGMAWSDVWREVTGGSKSNPTGLRIAVANSRRNPLRVLAETSHYEPEMEDWEVAAILSRPTARQAALLEQLPACERRLVIWDGWA